MKILVVDDERGIRELCSRALLYAGYECDLAEDGVNAVTKLDGGGFDIVLLDIIMPEKEGIETLLEIRRRWPDMKVIMMSGGGRIQASDFLGLASDLGADLTLSKPFLPSGLLTAVRSLSR